ncbi:MAG: N-acetylneuraminate synthase [Candidatus Kapabacteria bacterium]|nr:N-acetylneuraminate synthase [Candidatus Kapabacteria bacterium]
MSSQSAPFTPAIGQDQPVYVIAEIGINHNGSLDIAREMIRGAARVGASCVKFQKRTPELCVPRDQWMIERDTPWGRMTYIDYRYKVEFDEDDYRMIDTLCQELGIDWTVSCWDEEALAFMEANFDVPFYKAASASLTDLGLLKAMASTGKPLMISTGMSTMEEIDQAASALEDANLMIAHATSAYPCATDELNLRMIDTLQQRYPSRIIGYSGHEVGLATTYAAVALGAKFIERHITLDRAMWGTDQAASVEIAGLERMIRDIREIERSLGDGVKRLYDSELGARSKLRRVSSSVRGEA